MDPAFGKNGASARKCGVQRETVWLLRVQPGTIHFGVPGYNSRGIMDGSHRAGWYLWGMKGKHSSPYHPIAREMNPRERLNKYALEWSPLS